MELSLLVHNIYAFNQNMRAVQICPRIFGPCKQQFGLLSLSLHGLRQVRVRAENVETVL
jgi:hypothetical protein